MLSSVAEFLYTFMESGLDSDEDDNKDEGKESEGNRSAEATPPQHKVTPSQHALHLPYPGRILKMPKVCSELPPEGMRRKHPEHGCKITKLNTGNREFPRGAVPGGWVPPGCGCWLDKAKMIKEIKRKKGVGRPRCCLQPCQMHMLIEHLPQHCRWRSWTLTFSSEEHGSSLQALKARMTGRVRQLLVIKTTCGHVFGAFLSHAPNWSRPQHFIGNAETFVYHFQKGTLRFYPWSGANSYFVTAMTDGSIAVGSSAFFIDSDLRNGRTSACSTFASPPLTRGDVVGQDRAVDSSSAPGPFVNSTMQDSKTTPDDHEPPFVVQSLEVWGFEDDEAAVTNPSNYSVSLLRDPASPVPSDANISPSPSLLEFTDEDNPDDICQWHKHNSEHHMCCLQR